MAMAMKSGGGGGGGRRGRRRRGSGAVMNEINMTPFIDVVLVLLIIFMVAAPLMTSNVPIDLPEAAGKPAEGQVQPITISVDPSGKIFVADAEVPLNDLVRTMKAVAHDNTEQRVVFRGDKAAVWGATSKVLAELNNAGFHKIAIQMNPN